MWIWCRKAFEPIIWISFVRDFDKTINFYGDIPNWRMKRKRLWLLFFILNIEWFGTFCYWIVEWKGEKVVKMYFSKSFSFSQSGDSLCITIWNYYFILPWNIIYLFFFFRRWYMVCGTRTFTIYKVIIHSCHVLMNPYRRLKQKAKHLFYLIKVKATAFIPKSLF